jgi:uncharacterized protein YndB with AHSA1/START domain
MKFCDITVSRMIPASAQEVFDVWLDPKSPGSPWFAGKRVIVNPVVEGLFYLSIEHEGRVYPHYGRFDRIERPSRIEHTWVSEGTQGYETVVSISLKPKDGKTEVTLVHSGVPDDEEGRKHEQGWGWMLDMLAQRFEKAVR